MTAPRIFAATLRDHGLMVEPRPLGAVSTAMHLRHDVNGSDARGMQALYRRLVSLLVHHGCPRCDNGTGPTCAACCAELAAADRDASARATMTSLRGMFDPMTGRPDTSGWGA